MLFRVAFLLSLPSFVFAQGVRLGDAVLRDEPPVNRPAPHAQAGTLAVPSGWYNLSDRATVAAAWQNDFVPTRNIPTGFTGNVQTGVAGDTSAQYKAAVLQRINWYRAMAGVPAWVTLNATYNQNAQQAALMFAANGQISHFPPSTWLYYNSAAALAARSSNVCQGFLSDPGCMELYMADQGSNNAAAGHRRWILYPQTKEMGTGDVTWANNLWNDLWVFDNNYTAPRPATRDQFVAWPPKGYVPYQVVWPRWSFSYPGGDFSAASVSMIRGGAVVPLRLEPLTSGAGENSIVWIPDNQDTNTFTQPAPPATDTVYTVTVANVVVNGTAQTFTYQVIVFDPAVSPGQTCTYSLSNYVLQASSGYTNATLNLTAAGTGCSWTAGSTAAWAQVFPLSGTGSGTISYTIYPNYSTSGRSAAITIAGQTLAVTQQPSPGTPDERFVGQMYFNFFGRVPAPSEVAFQVQNALQQGTSRAELAERFLNSQEFNNAGRFVAGLYVGLLNRDPEYAGWLFQRNAFATGAVSQRQLVSNFLAGAEFTGTNGNLPNDDFVRLLYRQVLLREPSPDEVTYQSAALTRGVSRTDLAVNFLNSIEFRTGTQARLSAFLLYATLLNRGPSPAEMQNTMATLANTPVRTVIASILASQEFTLLLQ